MPKKIEEPLKGDGFGVGWYVPELNYEPITFVSTNPAGSNRNLRNLAPKIKTDCMIALVRVAGDLPLHAAILQNFFSSLKVRLGYPRDK